MRVLVTLRLTLTEELADLVEVLLLLTLLLGVAESEGHAVRVPVGVEDVVFVAEEEEDMELCVVADFVLDDEPDTVVVEDSVAECETVGVVITEAVLLADTRGEVDSERKGEVLEVVLTEVVMEMLRVGSREVDTDGELVFEADVDADSVVVGVGVTEGRTEGVEDTDTTPERLLEGDADTLLDGDGDSVGVLLMMDVLVGKTLFEWLAEPVVDRLTVTDTETVDDCEGDLLTDVEGVLDTEGVGVFDEEVDRDKVCDTLVVTDTDTVREGVTVPDGQREGVGVWEDVPDTDADFVDVEEALRVGALVEVSSPEAEGVEEEDGRDERLGVVAPVAEPVVELLPVCEGEPVTEWLKVPTFVGVFEDKDDLDTLVEDDTELEGEVDLEKRTEDDKDTVPVPVLLAVVVGVSEAVVEGDLEDAGLTEEEAETVDVWLPVAVALGDFDTDAEAVGVEEGDTDRVDVFEAVCESETLAERVLEGEPVAVVDAEGVRVEEEDAVDEVLPEDVLLMLADAVDVATVTAEALSRGELDSDTVEDAEAHTVGVRCKNEGLGTSLADELPDTDGDGEPGRPRAAACAPDAEKLGLTLALGVEDPEREGELDTLTVDEPPRFAAFAVALSVAVLNFTDTVAVLDVDSDTDTESDDVRRGEEELEVLSEALPLSEDDTRALRDTETDTDSVALTRVERDGALERVEESLTLGDKLAEAHDVELFEGAADAEADGEPPRRPPLGVNDCEPDPDMDGLVVEDSDTVEDTEPEVEAVDEGDTSALRLADAALVCVLDEEEDRDTDAEGVAQIEISADSVEVRLAVEDFVGNADTLCGRLPVSDAEPHWLRLIVRDTSGDFDGEAVTSGERDTDTDPDSEGEPVRERDMRAETDGACVGGAAFVVEGEAEAGVEAVDVVDTVLVLLEEGEEEADGVELGVFDELTEGVVVFEAVAEVDLLEQAVPVFEEVPETDSVRGGEGDNDALAQPEGEGVTGTLADADTLPVRLREGKLEALPEGEPPGEGERAGEGEPVGERPPEADSRAEEDVDADAAMDAERHGDADTEGVGALERDTDVEPEVVFVPVCEPEVDAEPGRSPPPPQLAALAVDVTPTVRVELTLADAVLVEDAEDVAEGVVDALCEMLEQPLGEGEGRMDRVDVVDGVSRIDTEAETECVDVIEGVVVGRGLRVVEAEGVRLTDAEGVLDEDVDVVTVRVGKLDLDTLFDADAEVVAVSVTLEEVVAEGLFDAVDVFEDVCDTEGDVVPEPPPGAAAPPSAVGDTEGVVVLLLEPEREGLGV